MKNDIVTEMILEAAQWGAMHPELYLTCSERFEEELEEHLQE